jgi:hypothetical protein
MESKKNTDWEAIRKTVKARQTRKVAEARDIYTPIEKKKNSHWEYTIQLSSKGTWDWELMSPKLPVPMFGESSTKSQARHQVSRLLSRIA